MSDYYAGKLDEREHCPLSGAGASCWSAACGPASGWCNMPSFADFLISVEAEMNKVSWPTRTELFRASMVVILVIFVLAAILFVYDVAWRFLLRMLG